MNFLKTACTAAAVVAAIALPGLAAAQSTWNLGASSCGSGSATYTSLTCTGTTAGETATMTAWGTSGGAGTALTSGTIANFDPSGLGAYVGTDSGSPYHAFDSTNPAGSTELMLISFGPYKVNLSSIAIGWYSTDADVSILRYDGAYTADAGSLVNGKTTTQLLASGWTLVGSEQLTTLNFDNPNDSTTGNSAYKSTMNLGTTASSYWIISTYFGATSGSLDSGNDNFKILNYTATITGTCSDPTKTAASGCTTGATGGTVPEPTSLALVGLAGLGAFGLRRRAARKAA